MFEEFYGLTAKPFSKTPDPGFLYLSRSHEEALARLQYAVEEKEIVLLTGEIGCGKTTVTRALIDSLDEKHRIILIVNPRLSPNQFLRVIARRFDIDLKTDYKDSLMDMIYDKVYEDYENGITPVIIIDEAQLIPDIQTFEEIRLLTNFQLDDANLISVILVGQPDLKRKVSHKAFEPLKQRIGLFYHLGPLNREEATDYIVHRLSVAGRKEILFTISAVEAIYKYSCGIPRVINNLATASLLEGFGTGANVIDETIIDSAAREVGLLEDGLN